MRFMMQDCIMVADEICTAGSKMLYNFKAPFNATVYEKCLDSGMEFVGFTAPDEFGVDNLFDSSDEQDPAVTALLEQQCDAVLANDIFGKLRRQGPQQGLIYIQPAYGTVSRFGLIPAISSMDQIGILCASIEDGLTVLAAISGHDSNDGTSLPQGPYIYSEGKDGGDKKGQLTVGVPDAPAGSIASLDTVKLTNVELKYFDVLAQAFYILAAAEISNNTTRYDGVKFGYRAENTDGINDLYIRSRTEGFGRDLQLASIVGCMVLSQEHYDGLYHKAMQIRRLARDYYAGLLAELDALALPVKLDLGGKYEQSALYALPALGGFPSLALPYKDTPVQFIGKRGGEDALFTLAKEGLSCSTK